jgi:hypothetical protein
VNVSIIGTGHVGLPTGACLAERGHRVLCVDKDHRKVALLRRGTMPIYEPGLEDLVVKNRRAGRLRKTSDASLRGVAGIVMAGRSEPLDVGRRPPVVPPAMRRAVIVRDRHCRFPGCDRPHTWCDAHHVVHWADGGPTALPNLVLLCRRHHRLVHERGFSVERAGQDRLRFRRPDGSPIPDVPACGTGDPAHRLNVAARLAD